MYGCYYQNNIMTSIKRELLEYGLFPKKGLGQHFLVDRNILDKVIRTAQVEKEDVVLEVGPGLGEMTLALARLAKRVIAVEIDSKLVDILKKKLTDCPNVDVVKGDILTINFRKIDTFDGAKPRFLNRGKKRRSALVLSNVEGVNPEPSARTQAEGEPQHLCWRVEGLTL